MPSIAKCIKKLGDSIDPSDAARVLSLAKKYKADGMTRSESDIEAVKDLTLEARTERADLGKKIEAAGGVMPSRAKPKRR